MQRDHSTLLYKVNLRRRVLSEMAHPVVMETHGGWGTVYDYCYRSVEDGIVFETNPDKNAVLARQRPAWGVYQAKCEQAIVLGVGKEWSVNILDCDPYGEPWTVLRAFFQSERPFPSTLAVVVNDGLRQGVKMHGGWTIKSLQDKVDKYGTGRMYKNYLEVCQELLAEYAALQGYDLQRWVGYYCGHAQQMTHYAAIFSR